MLTMEFEIRIRFVGDINANRSPRYAITACGLVFSYNLSETNYYCWYYSVIAWDSERP